jgi:general secretion pathway protein D
MSRQWTRLWTAGLLLPVLLSVASAQTVNPPPPQKPAPEQATQAQSSPSLAAPDSQSAVTATAPAKNAQPAKPSRGNDRRRAAKLYLQASKLFEKERFEEAMRDYRQAAKLDPSNADYPLAANLALSHTVTALIQSAAKDRLRGDAAGERAALAHALELDPKNIEVTEHLYELSDDALRGQSRPLYEQAANTIGEDVTLLPRNQVHNLHLHADQTQIIKDVFNVYGLDAILDESIHSAQVRLDMDDATFEEATRVLGMITNSFFVPLDAHRVLVAVDNRENRMKFMRQELETVYLSGLTDQEMTDVINLAKNVFQMSKAVKDSTAGTITLLGTATTLNAFNATLRELLDGRSQVLIDVRLIQLAHTSQRNTGIQPPQSFSAVNVYAEEQSILTANQSLVSQIISSGLAKPGDTLAILGILLASGQISNSLLSNGIALFGGGITQSALSPGKITANFNLNSSDSRELEELQLRLGDGEEGSLKVGERYPIQTSSFSSLSASLPNIPGLTGAGSSSALGSLLTAASSVPNVPQVEYQDLGLTLKATPRVMRNDEVALTVDLKIDALSGTSLNGNPILDNRAYSGVVMLKKGEGVVVAGELDKSQSRAISGVPGFSEIPGLNDVTDKDTQKSYSTLLIIMTPHVVRGTHAAGHSPMMRLEKNTPVR